VKGLHIHVEKSESAWHWRLVLDGETVAKSERHHAEQESAHREALMVRNLAFATPTVLGELGQ
jgi:hypothetical protein